MRKKLSQMDMNYLYETDEKGNIVYFYRTNGV